MDNFTVVLMRKFENVHTSLSTGAFLVFHVEMWKKIGDEKIPYEGVYREELMLAVISRTADCKEEAGSFRLISTLRMEWMTVE